MNQVDIETNSRARERWWICAYCDNTRGTSNIANWMSYTHSFVCGPCLLDIKHPEEIYDVVWKKVNDRGDHVPMWTVRLPPEPVPDPPPKAKEYWYFLTWTMAPGHTIEEVKKNISKFLSRDLGFLACDTVLEHGGEYDREHYHMRLKLSRPLKKQKIAHYNKVGFVHMVSCRKQTQENWESVEGYMTKENEIVTHYPKGDSEMKN